MWINFKTMKSQTTVSIGYKRANRNPLTCYFLFIIINIHGLFSICRKNNSVKRTDIFYDFKIMNLFNFLLGNCPKCYCQSFFFLPDDNVKTNTLNLTKNIVVVYVNLMKVFAETASFLCLVIKRPSVKRAKNLEV